MVSTPLVSSLPTGTVETMAGANKQDIRYPWSFWDVTRGPTRVVAHIVGGVSHVGVGSKEGTESHTDSLEDMA